MRGLGVELRVAFGNDAELFAGKITFSQANSHANQRFVPSGSWPRPLTFSGGELQVGDAEDSSARLVAQAGNFPAVREHNLLHHGETESGAFLVRGEIRLENFPLIFRQPARAVVEIGRAH